MSSDQSLPVGDMTQRARELPDAAVALWTRWLTLATLALVIVSFVSAVISGFQWMEIHKSSADTQALAAAAARQADAARTLAEASQAQVQSLEEQQRAWIGGNGMIVDALKAGQGISSHVTYNNFGRNPALVHHSILLKIYYSEEFNQLFSNDISMIVKGCKDFGANDQEDFGMVFPGAAYSANNSTDSATTDSILKGNRVFVRLDCFIYQIGSKTVHSESCYYFDNKNVNNVFFCPRGIFAD